jgi:hypothetical protein
MAKVTKNIVDKNLRDIVFDGLLEPDPDILNSMIKINDRQYGILLTDLNGVQRYVRIGAIVAEERDDMTAEELMQSEINAYLTKQAEKEANAKTRAEKAKKDKERRAKEKEEKENE